VVLASKHNSYRLAPNLFSAIICIVCMLCSMALAATPATITVSGTIYCADGVRTPSGKIIVTPTQAFTAADGTLVRGSITVVVTAGAYKAVLVPTVGASPSGVSYRVEYMLSPGIEGRPYWSIPASGGPYTISQVETQTLTGTSATVPQQQLSEGTGLAVLLDFYRAASATATRVGQCYWDTDTNSLTCSTAAGVWKTLPFSDGNVATATALAADPADCTNQFARGVNASGTAQCASVAGTDFGAQVVNRIFAGPAAGDPALPTFRVLASADIPNNAADTSGNAGTATALAADPADCGANTFTNAINASGTLSCTAVGNAATTATSSNTASAIVARDASGNFSAGTISAALSGNAGTATALAADPTDCAANTFTNAINASGTLSCTSIVAADLGTTLTPQFARVGAGQAADATAPFAGTIDSATTNTILDVLKLTRSTTGTAGNGIGTAFVLYAEDASGNIEEAGRFQASFPIAAHATQTGRVDITVMGVPGGSLATAGSTAWGVNAGQNNTGVSQTATGNYAGYSNTGNYQTATGFNAGNSNSGVSQTATGVNAGQNNTGAYQTATGNYAGYSNSGAYQTATGNYAGFYNTGGNQTTTGVNAGRNNTGASQTATGYSAGLYNTGDYQTATGYGAGQANNWPNITRIGHQSSVYFPDDAGSLKNITEASITAANTITYVAHGFGTPGGKVNVRYLLTGGTPPVGLVHNTIYQFTVTSANVLTLSGIAFPAAAFTGTLNNSTDTSNSIAIGVDTNPTKANQVVLGPTSITETVLRGTVTGPIYIVTTARTTATGDITLTSASASYQFIDPNGTDRNCTLPGTPATGLAYTVKNFGTANTITVKDAAAATLVTLTVGDTATIIYDGTAWQVI